VEINVPIASDKLFRQ